MDHQDIEHQGFPASASAVHTTGTNIHPYFRVSRVWKPFDQMMYRDDSIALLLEQPFRPFPGVGVSPVN